MPLMSESGQRSQDAALDLPRMATEPFPSGNLVGWKDADGFGKPSGGPGTAAPLARDVPGLSRLHPTAQRKQSPPVKGTSQLGSVAMAYVNLGATGLRVSRVCLGMMSFGNNSERPWVLGEDAAEPIVRAAADGGVIFFDTAKPVRH